MKFKEWLNTEMRKPYRDYMKRRFPDMPDAVRHELGTNTVVPQLKKIAGNSSPGSQTNQLGTTIPYEPNQPNRQSPFQQTVTHSPSENSPYNSPKELIDRDEKIQKFQNANWPDKPSIITVNLDAFDPRTQDTIKFLRFGFADNIPVKRHGQRMGDQEKLMGTRGADEMEPVIVIKQQDGYELLEGWHRVFNYLLSGAPPEEKEALMQGNMSAYEVDYDKWRPVKIKAYVGLPKKVA